LKKALRLDDKFIDAQVAMIAVNVKNKNLKKRCRSVAKYSFRMINLP